MIHEIKRIHENPNGNNYGESALVDDEVSENEIRRNVPNFFKTKFGKRETFTFYRGCVIARHTMQFTGMRPTRLTVVYYYDTKDKDTFCLSCGADVHSVYQAKKLIDRMFEVKCTWYGMQWDGSDEVPKVP